jgi:hypothetical protein
LHLIGVPVYLLILTLSLWKAVVLINKHEYIALVCGILLFYVSDYIVISGLIYDLPDAANNIIWFTYIPSLFLISITNIQTLKIFGFRYSNIS